MEIKAREELTIQKVLKLYNEWLLERFWPHNKLHEELKAHSTIKEFFDELGSINPKFKEVLNGK